MNRLTAIKRKKGNFFCDDRIISKQKAPSKRQRIKMILKDGSDVRCYLD